MLASAHVRAPSHYDLHILTILAAYTVSRAILADAIALTRGDRFFTSDYTPFNMTSWGFADCQRDPSAPGYGSTIGRLLLRTLPNHFAPDSTYTWFPLMTPDAMRPILTKLGDLELYDLGKPVTTATVPEVGSYREAGKVLAGSTFGVPYAGRAAHVIKGNGYVTSVDPAVVKNVAHHLYGSGSSLPRVTQLAVSASNARFSTC